ncbi:MAG: SDR family oxidoreductase [Desulfobacterales bacterium]|jgi:NAD(P)-dependent dehydrogenase (short-subunit alcohol dehydrogenase family)
MEPNALTGKIAVITGGASGIGAAISRTFAAHGAKLGLLDSDGGALEAAAADLAARGCQVRGICCDVAREDECETAIRTLIAHFGGIDILVNNAGITQRSAFVATKVSVYRQVMDVNFFGALHCTKVAMASLIERQGTIIVIESLAAVAPLLGRTGYCASKHALHGLFTSLRAELIGSGVHIMIVCPGFVKTNLQARALGANGRVTRHPQSTVGRQDSPARVADAVYRAMLKRKKMLILSPVGKLTYWLSRVAPGLYERMMARQLKSELIRKSDPAAEL